MPQNLFVLTGAGISAESGLGTFRDKRGEGSWAKFDPMKLATPEAFARDPEAVLAFYDLRRRNLRDAKPNAAHFALARLEGALAKRGDSLMLVTQNIDDLHERAGSWRVIHMHGELLKARCRRCEVVGPWLDDLTISDVCPNCGDAGVLRPHVVWLGSRSSSEARQNRTNLPAHLAGSTVGSARVGAFLRVTACLTWSSSPEIAQKNISGGRHQASDRSACGDGFRGCGACDCSRAVGTAGDQAPSHGSGSAGRAYGRAQSL